MKPLNRRELQIGEIHEILYAMLQYLDEVCRENHITYFLSGGTAIGAIREKGFIPWDDDLDIMLPRGEYDRLIRCLEERNHPAYKVYSLRDSTWNRPYSCLVDETTEGRHELVNYSHIGVTMDILPMDGLPDSFEKVKRYYRILRLKYAFYYSSIKEDYAEGEKLLWAKKLMGVLARRIGAHRISEHIDRCARKMDYATANYVGCSVLIHFMEKERFDKDWFKSQEYVAFNGGAFPVMNGYDEYLRALYGNYMKRPETESDPDHHTHYYRKNGKGD